MVTRKEYDDNMKELEELRAEKKRNEKTNTALESGAPSTTAKDSPPKQADGAPSLEDKVNEMIGKTKTDNAELYECGRCGFSEIKRSDRSCPSCNYELAWDEL